MIVNVNANLIYQARLKCMCIKMLNTKILYVRCSNLIKQKSAMIVVFAVFPSFSYVTGQVVLESGVRYVLKFHFPIF